MSEWISCKDELPKKRGFVLVFDGEDVCIAEYTGNYFGIRLNDQDYVIAATHWMQRPEPPK